MKMPVIQKKIPREAGNIPLEIYDWSVCAAVIFNVSHLKYFITFLEALLKAEKAGLLGSAFVF